MSWDESDWVAVAQFTVTMVELMGRDARPMTWPGTVYVRSAMANRPEHRLARLHVEGSRVRPHESDVTKCKNAALRLYNQRVLCNDRDERKIALHDDKWGVLEVILI